ncbi:hydrogenase expression/formation protein HypE [Prosthecochloris sp. N3]|uniref:Hydrogenase expression/formation protein HypE n=1 Tax=Prosthecochloris ethylica TaxID=2743976 RepID=A0ABR9XTL6_9CHLB|nr:hydrogenase expression/formation protein HypE [Prosthecochloris ethylica]MBF0587169.1 hydrogenase expression/formation protein HypE [Prosthecochloris ethylica]MBF0637247.1 hydrogenase expression/formation protein HypE [Prosthecochloris ethylica]NUK48438.1 hydrogenase expression/formation protein HypE [Prosthecochloris ethylica]
MQLSCPSPVLRHETVQMAHGAGGRLSQELTARVFMPYLGNPLLDQLDDQARFDAEPGRIAFTTDTYVVTPIFFPGGTIGDLAVNGTVNDLAVGGAVPRYLSAGFVLEEGLPLADLERVVKSMADAARKAGVVIACGDTKVVQKGQCDRMFINTSGVGFIPPGRDLSCRNLRPGDAVLLSGTVGDHGMAILTTREGLSFQNRISSDSAALNGLVADVLQAAPHLHAMRDPTRGGVAATLNELAAASSVGIELDEASLPVREDVRGACELLGIDPLTVANEGKVIVVVPRDEAEAVLEAMNGSREGKDAAIIGEVVREHPGMVVMRTAFGSRRILDMPLGEQLPRIC